MNPTVYEGPRGVRLVGGLDWRLLPVGGNVGAGLREGAADRGASHAAIALALEEEIAPLEEGVARIRPLAAGYYANPGAKLPKKAHSLAAAFASWAREHRSALLSVRTSTGARAVVVVVNGLPVLDRIEPDAPTAFERIQSYLRERADLSVFSDDLERFPSSLDGEDLLARIAMVADRTTEIRPIPPNVLRWGLTFLLFATLMGGYLFHARYEAEKKRVAVARARRDADPLPKYLEAFATASRSVGASRADLLRGLRTASDLPLDPGGWTARTIRCQVAKPCEVELRRETGTFNSLRAAMPALRLVESGVPDLNAARMAWGEVISSSPLPEGPPPALTTFFQGAEASRFQDWLVAGLTLVLAPPRLWPDVPGVPADFRHPSATRAGAFEVQGVALSQMAEVIESAPPNIVWTGWVIELGAGDQDAMARAVARITGTYYLSGK